MRLLSSVLGRGFWAIANQASVSIGTFLLQIVIARLLDPREFGVFVLIYGLMFAISVVPGALVLYPLTLQGASADNRRLSELSGSALSITFLLCAPLTMALFGGAYYLDRPTIAPMAVFAFLAWQLKEVLRRALLSHLQHGRAMWGDAAAHLGPAVAALGLHGMGRLSVESAFVAMGLSSLVGLGVQWWQVKPRILRRAGMWESLRLGRWMLLADVTGALMIQALPWGLAVVHGLAAAGTFAALLNVLKVTHPILYSINGLMIPVTAKAAAGPGGVRDALRAAIPYGMLVLVLVLPYYLAAALWPGWILALFYGSASSYLLYERLVFILVLAYCFYAAGNSLSGLLNGLQQSRLVLVAQLAALVIVLAAGMPLVWKFGVLGACLTLAIVFPLQAALQLWFAVRLRTADVAPPQVAVDALAGGSDG